MLCPNPAMPKPYHPWQIIRYNDCTMDGLHRRSVRLKGYDYTQAGAYFITVCTHRWNCLLATIADEETVLSRYGEIVQKCWDEIPSHFAHAELDTFVIMPNHLHGIVVLTDRSTSHTGGTVGVQHADGLPLDNVGAQHAVPSTTHSFHRLPPGSLPAIIRSFKSASTKRINDWRGTRASSVWQRNYHEHVIRNDSELDRIREYVATNPLKWALDRENPHRTGASSFEETLFDPHPRQTS
jgi:REP element-mobilizing transposase RayT